MSIDTTAAPAARESAPQSSPLVVVKAALRPLASLRLTVVLFVLSFLLVFFGTVAQINQGIWTVVDQYFWSWSVWVPFDLFARFGEVFFYVPKSFHLPGHFPFPAGKLLAALLCVNLVAAHLVRFRLTWKRSGVMTLHAGLLLMLAGEVVTREASVEQQMVIEEGGSANYAEDMRHAELVVIDKSDPKSDFVVGIPFSRLKPGGRITHPDLPVDVEVVETMKNSALVSVGKSERPNPATVGTGQMFVAEEKSEVSGVDTAQKFDQPAAYVRLLKKGTDEPVGTHLTAMWLGLTGKADAFTANGKPYELALRPTRYYKPFTLHLIDFRFDRYVGTEKARNYSSLVRLVDAEEGVDEEVLISMNNPLRHRDEAFYQSSFDATEKATVLQVVHNPGWLLPYASCCVVGVGMLVHFAITLAGFARRQQVARQTADGGTTGLQRALPWLALAAAVIAFLGVAGRSVRLKGDGYDLDGFSKLPVVDGGRVKPIDTVARVYLRLICGREELVEDGADKQPAVKWLLDAMTAGDIETQGPAWKYKVFKIDNDQVLGLLGLEPRSGFRYSLAEIAPKFQQLNLKAQQARGKDEKKWTLEERKAVETRRKLEYFLEFNQHFAPLHVPIDPAKEEWKSLADVRQAARQTAAQAVFTKAGININNLETVPADRQRELLRELEAEFIKQLAANPAADFWDRIIKAYKSKDKDKFNAAVAEYRDHLAGTEVLQTRPRLETLLNRTQPFLYATGFYVVAAVLGLLGLLVGGEPLRRAAFNVIVFTLVLHTAALVARMVIQGRPPVTNLYSSAIFIGWGGVGLGLILERLYRNGFGNLIGATLGFATGILAHNYLGGGEDTLEMMQAVLDTNFWLATHVTTVTLGYVATYIASLLAAAYLVCVVLVPGFRTEAAKQLARMTYGVVCFATLLSFVGTVLGGIWADQSWGRFWGWDPKENGAVMIVIWNALILHARWAGLVKDPGVAVLAVLGGAVTTWSYFGTNQLQVGLHSYGFSNELAVLCLGVWLATILVACLRFVPRRLWLSQLATKG